MFPWHDGFRALADAFDEKGQRIRAEQDEKARINIVSGTYQGIQGPVNSLTGINAFTLELKAEAKVHIHEPAERNALLYQLNGTAAVNGVSTGDTKMVLFNQDGEDIEIEAQTDGVLLYVAGYPIGEKVTQYGPFVMNTPEELRQAMDDYQSGKMGSL